MRAVTGEFFGIVAGLIPILALVVLVTNETLDDKFQPYSAGNPRQGSILNYLTAVAIVFILAAEFGAVLATLTDGGPRLLAACCVFAIDLLLFFLAGTAIKSTLKDAKGSTDARIVVYRVLTLGVFVIGLISSILTLTLALPASR